MVKSEGERAGCHTGGGALQGHSSGDPSITPHGSAKTFSSHQPTDKMVVCFISEAFFKNFKSAFTSPLSMNVCRFPIKDYNLYTFSVHASVCVFV